MPKPIAIAIGAHPDDIEFYMAGTLVLLERTGWETHYLNVGNGCCGSVQYDAKKTRHHNCHCFSSSVDAAHFGKAADGDEHDEEKYVPRPRLGFSVEAVQTPARVKVTCVTPLGEEVASTL